MNRSTMTKWLWMAGILLLTACDSAPRLTPLAVDAKILAIGDSLTWGTGGGEAGSYPYQLELLTGRRVINAGVPGEISSAGARRLPGLLAEHQPQLLILCHGGNDLLQRLDQQALRKNLTEMITVARQAGVEVVMVGVPNPGLLLSPPALYKELATEFNLPYQGDILADLVSDSALKSDAVHLNAAGYRQLAEGLYELLKKARAL